MLLKILCLLLAIIAAVQCRSARNPKCLEPVSPGNCYAYMPRFAFDSSQNRCVRFVYGGCGGNDNRFDSIEQCKEVCDVH